MSKDEFNFEGNFELVQVKITLKEKQKLSNDNSWWCTILGKYTEVTRRNVVFHAPNLKEAVKSFDETEVKEYTITKTKNQ